VRQVSLDKYSIAWFKLAECVARGEKERALGVYRLLSHSFEDQAFAVQLGADLLWAFDDEQAIIEYDNAAQLYQKDNKLVEAVAIYEHLIMLEPKKELYIQKCIDLYVRIGNKEPIVRHIKCLLFLQIENGLFDSAQETIAQLADMVHEEYMVEMYQKMFFALMQHKHEDKKLRTYYLYKVLDYFIKTADTKKMSRFLSDVQREDSDHAYDASCYVKEST
jgi:tetratricopeptide (TPR) repeat protein